MTPLDRLAASDVSTPYLAALACRIERFEEHIDEMRDYRHRMTPERWRELFGYQMDVETTKLIMELYIRRLS